MIGTVAWTAVSDVITAVKTARALIMSLALKDAICNGKRTRWQANIMTSNIMAAP